MSSKSKPTTNQREYFRAMLKRNERSNGNTRMEAIMAAYHDGDIWPRIADPYGMYSGTEQFFEALPLMRTIPHDGDTYRCYLANLPPERYEYNGSADCLRTMWADLEAQVRAGRVRPLTLTRYLADLREAYTLRPIPARVLRSEDGAEIWIPAERLNLVHTDLDELMDRHRFEQVIEKPGAVRVICKTRYPDQGADMTVAWTMPVEHGHQRMEQQ